MSTFLSFRDGGKTDENGISQYLYGFLKNEVLNGLVVSQNSPLGMSVAVSQGRCMIDSGSDYPYLGFTDDTETVVIATADGSNPRVDTIVAYVDLAVVDSTNPNNPGAFLLTSVSGTPAGSPTAPNDAAILSAIGLGNPFIRLANVFVGAAVTNITNGNISDERVLATLVDGIVTTNTLADDAVTPAKTAVVPFCRITDTTQSTTNGNMATISFDTEVTDTDTMFDPGTPTRITIKTDGIYQINGSTRWDANTNGRRGLFIYVDGSAIISGQESLPDGTYGYRQSLSAAMYLTANQYIELRCVQTAGSIAANNSELSVAWLGKAS